MPRKPNVYVICGFIGAGKTTFAINLENETGAVRITKDSWLIRLIGHNPDIPGYAELDGAICGLSRDFAFYLVEKGIDVILDEGFWAPEERAAIRARIESLGAEPVLYFIDTPIDEIRKRVAERNLNPTENAFRIESDLLEGYLRLWQPPQDDEGYTRISAMPQN